MLTQFISAIEDDVQQFGLDFTDLDDSKSAFFFAQLDATCDEALLQVNQLLIVLIRELEAQAIPSYALKM